MHGSGGSRKTPSVPRRELRRPTAASGKMRAVSDERSGTVASTDVLIVGAGAAGLMCAMTAAGRGRRVRVLDHANKAGKKILMSDGGRCNFTNQIGRASCRERV